MRGVSCHIVDVYCLHGREWRIWTLYLVYEPLGCIIFYPLCKVVEAVGIGDMSLSVADMLGGLVFFVGIAIAVGMIVYDSIRMGKWKMFGKGTKRLDFAAESYVKEQMENFRATYALYITLGVVLCITSVVPAMVMGEISWRMNDFSMDDIAGALFLVMVAVGVMFFILGGMRKGCYEGLLQENQVVMNKEKEHQKELEKNILSVYWPTVTCIYLIWSFLTMDWYISWIIWPIAAVVERIIKLICSEKK